MKTVDFGYERVTPAEKTTRVRGVFDSVAGNYDLMNDLMSGGLHRLWKRFAMSQTGLRPGGRALDVASGTGDLGAGLARQVGSTGLAVLTDINREMLSIGRDRLLDQGIAGNVIFAIANAECLPFPDRSFDCVVSVRTLTHAADWRRLLAELLRVAGRAVVVDYPEASGANRFYGALFRWKRAVEGDTRPYRRFAPGEVAREAARHGFGRPELRRQVLLPLVVHRAADSAAFTRVVEGAGQRLGLTEWLGGPALLRLGRMP